MSAPTTQIPAASATRSILSRSPVWRVGAVASVVAAMVTVLFALGAKAIDIPLEAPALGEDTAERIPVGAFAVVTLMWSAVGTVLAVVLARRAKRPARTFVVTTVVLTLLSLVQPLTADTDTASQVTLALSHLVAAAVVIPPLALRLSER